MSEFSERERRRYYRLRYPRVEMPRILLKGKGYALTEISEEGVRFFCEGICDFRMGQVMNVRIDLHLGRTLIIEGKIIRIDRDEVAMLLTRGIPMRVVVEEQRYLINKYPMT